MDASDTLPTFDELWNYGDPAGTEQLFREILPVAHASGNVSYLAELLTQIARTRALQRRFEEAHGTLDEVEAHLPDASERAVSSQPSGSTA